MTDSAVRLENVSKTFGSFEAVKDLSFHIDKGEIYGFLGPNGAGKTTTLRMMLDIISPSNGALSILGSASATRVRRRIGYLPEERGLYKKMRAAQSIAYFAQLRGIEAREAKARAARLMEEFGLEEFSNSKNDALSKGMAQKVQLLATIAHEPELLILDEPFSGLDPINQQTLEDLIRRQRDAGKTILFSTHVMQHAERLCDRFLIMSQGRARFEGSLNEARALFTAKLQIRSSASRDDLMAVGGIKTLDIVDGEETGKADGAYEYELELDSGEDPQVFLARAVERGIPILRFEKASATLHDIFVSLAGDSATDKDAVEGDGS